MTLAVLGSEAVSFTGPGTGLSDTLTPPVGATWMVFQTMSASVMSVDNMYVGSTATQGTELGDTENRGAVYGRAQVWVIETGFGSRLDDTMYIDGSGPGFNVSGHVVYGSGNIPVAVASAVGSWSSANLSYTTPTPPVSGGNLVGFVIGDKYNVNNHAATGSTVDLGSDPGNASYYLVGADDAAVTLTNTSSSAIAFGSRVWYYLYESVVIANVAPNPINPLFQFQSGTVQIGSNAVINAGAMRAFELKFNAGTFSTLAKRQVALVGEQIETSEMTEGGGEGDILTQHASKPPTWEPPGGHAHGYSGELLITDTPAGVPLVFADILQTESEDELLYEDVNP